MYCLSESTLLYYDNKCLDDYPTSLVDQVLDAFSIEGVLLWLRSRKMCIAFVVDLSQEEDFTLACNWKVYTRSKGKCTIYSFVFSRLRDSQTLGLLDSQGVFRLGSSQLWRIFSSDY